MTNNTNTTKRSDLARYIRVAHADERAADQIYRDQLAALDDHEMGDEIRCMTAQGVEHLKTFDTLINERWVRLSF
tara:strand:- start:266 stop:490 length:225 start_codon:yes stop_codon:yes gene_type:complete